MLDTLVSYRKEGSVWANRANRFSHGFSGIRVAQSLVFYVVFCRLLFVFWLLYCMSLFYFRFLITQVRVITVFTVFRLLTDFVCLYTYEFWLSLCKIARSSVILLLPLFANFKLSLIAPCFIVALKVSSHASVCKRYWFSLYFYIVN